MGEFLRSIHQELNIAELHSDSFVPGSFRYMYTTTLDFSMAETSSAPVTAPEDAWKHTGVRVIPADSLDSNTAQTPGTSTWTPFINRPQSDIS